MFEVRMMFASTIGRVSWQVKLDVFQLSYFEYGKLCDSRDQRTFVVDGSGQKPRFLDAPVRLSTTITSYFERFSAAIPNHLLSIVSKNYKYKRKPFRRRRRQRCERENCR